MMNVSQQRCFNHAVREAAARCPECRQFFCRECITEHEDRVLCTACLRMLAQPLSIRRRSFAPLKRFVECAAGILLAWFFFFLVGESLGRFSDSFHEGVIWQVPWIDSK